MSISKISRSLVVVIFVALIIFITYEDVILLFNIASNNTALNILKVVYIIVTIALVALYVYIKDKLYRKKAKRNIALVYRYIYISFIVIIMSIISIYKYLYLINNLTLIMYVLLKLAIGIILKRIIFNVSKSDILSVFGLFSFAMLPCVYSDVYIIFINLINTLILFISILIIQKIVDELKQRGIKNKKYIYLAILLSIFIGCTLLLGISPYIWIIIALMSLLLTVNLDKTHLEFSKKIISLLNQKTKDILYKVERINISKLIIAIIIITLGAYIIFYIGSFIITKLNFQNIMLKELFNIEVRIDNINLSGMITKFIENTNIFLSTSRTYYILLLGYIVFIEILAFALHRRYDTKSTVMKLIFILLYLSITIFDLNIINYHTIFTILLILIAIVNTSNIYLNREERVKMLVA